ncbi:MAG TPA: hypothetical protein VEQ11_07300 [Chloroflexota bacterium]|nr:hypothetical protein [Chloroflexota bacterium]
MPRTSRTVAQRLASQARSRKRRGQRAAAGPMPVIEKFVEAAESEGSARTGRVLERKSPLAPGTIPRVGAQPRRRYADYGEEYRYIWADLRRIGIVAGSLLLLLFLLAPFIR